MEPLESQIGEWRSYVTHGQGVEGTDVEELETHLRDQIADLARTGLTDEEAFLVAVKRMGAIDTLSREFAREHSGRLWKQLVLTGNGGSQERANPLTEAIAFAIMAAVAVQILRLTVIQSDVPGADLLFLRNASLITLPFLTWYLGRRHELTLRQSFLAMAPFATAALVVNLYPWADGSSSEILVGIHLPVAMWFVVGYSHSGGRWRSHERRMDVVRFTGEWFIYFVLIALGGGVLLALTLLILEPVSPGVAEQVAEWVLISGAAGAVIVAAWLTEAKQGVVENMAPVLAKVFTPLFALMLATSAITYAVSGLGEDFDRDLLSVFDALLVVVLGLVLYGVSARDSTQPAGLFDRVQLVAVVSALGLDLMVLGSMILRISDLGFTPNRVAALGLNLVLLVNLSGVAWLSMRALRGRSTFHPLEQWQMAYLPAFGAWAGAVVVALPLLFGFA